MQTLHTAPTSGDLLTRVLRRQPELVRDWEPVVNDKLRVDFGLIREHGMQSVSDWSEWVTTFM